jgi:type IV secretion system protein VirD4
MIRPARSVCTWPGRSFFFKERYPVRATPARVLRAILKLAVCCVGFGLFMIGMHIPFVFFLTAAGVVWNRFRRVVRSGWSHGTARLASHSELIRSNMLGDDGLILGTTGIMSRPSFLEGLTALCSTRTSPELGCYLFLSALGGSRWVNDRMIRLHAFTHLLTCAPTGRGKGIGVIVPNLLSYRHSCVVTDPKGELFQLTAEHRRRKFGHRIIRLDPFGLCGPGSDTLNPLDFIDADADDFLDQCRDLADLLIVTNAHDIEPYWNDSARSVLTAFIAYVCACEDKRELRTLESVRDLLSCRSTYHKAIEWMQQVKSHGGVIERLGHMMTWHVERELASVLSNVHRFTEALDSAAIKRNVSAPSSFDPKCLRTGRVTIYLILPHDKLSTLAAIMRLWVGVILRTITEGQPSERNPVLFLLDEAAHLGKMAILETAVTLMRGMGIRLWFIFQSLNQSRSATAKRQRRSLKTSTRNNSSRSTPLQVRRKSRSESAIPRFLWHRMATTPGGRTNTAKMASDQAARRAAGVPPIPTRGVGC